MILSQQKQEFKVTLTVTEIQARALDALVVYGDDAFINNFYEFLGKHYMQPHEQGLRSLFKEIRSEMPTTLARFDEARKVFQESKFQHKQS